MTDVHAGTPFTEEQVALAASNYEAQEWLLRALREAFVMSGLSLQDLASELDLSSEDAEAWINGEMDLTLSELRQLANVVDAHVTYRVNPVHTKYVDRFERISKDLWQEVPWSASHEITLA